LPELALALRSIALLCAALLCAALPALCSTE